LAFCAAVAGLIVAASSSHAQPGSSLEERKLPMRFTWIACQPNCPGWIGAVGVVTADTPREFEEFAASRQVKGAAIVLDSSGGSVNDAITLGRRWRGLGLMTTVGATVEIETAAGRRPSIAPDAYCESMCVFLLLSGKSRYVPAAAHVRVHQIWMGDRADDPKASHYTAQDMTIVERDIGRLAKFTFDMGGSGDLLALALSVAPWEDLHRLSPDELQLSNLVTTDTIATLLPPGGKPGVSVADLDAKPVQDRFAGSKTEPKTDTEKPAPLPKSTKTAEATVPGGLGSNLSAQPQH
jgi:hypothetical protein